MNWSLPFFPLMVLCLAPAFGRAVEFPPAGALVVEFQLDQPLYPTGTRAGSDGGAVELVETPLFSAELRPHSSFVGLDLSIVRKEPKAPLDGNLARLMWSRLEAGKRYHVVFAWDVGADVFDVYLNGVLQEVCTPVRIPFWEDGVPGLVGEIVEGPIVSGVRLLDAVPDAEEVAAMAREAGVPSLSGEGRTLFDERLTVSRGELLFAADFSQPLDVVREDALFENGERVRKPDALWVLEGEGDAFTREGWLVLETGRWTPRSRWENGAPVWEDPSHLVLWLNRKMPDGILVEYEIEVEDPLSGLHILFFSATNAQGGSIFEPGLSRRNADFGRYIRNPDEFLSYHISFWAAPYDIVRRTSNLRKNGPFLLQAVGDDRIVHAGKGPHRIRVLKNGPHIAAEVNGAKIIDFVEEEAIYGAAYGGGFLGFRLMGFSKWMKIRSMKVSALASHNEPQDGYR